MPTVLSTKKLAANQKELLLNSGISLVEYDAIKITYIDFAIEEKQIKNAIFTSKNAVKAIEGKDLKIGNCFCVGDKTAALLEQNGYSVIEKTQNSAELGKALVEYHHEKHFHFFCGNKRRDELPEILKEHKVNFSEIQVYETALNPKKFESDFDGIMFFSPSGVKSFVQENKIKNTAFCIGSTTAEEAAKYTDNILVASKPGIENVIAKVVAYFKK
ncbi:uroporphyrinogen-III synthase [Gramella jeungdoensis]|uniref:Uroporphyrinogen-III synthase n=1 Tax=Gramella jeungdoensis TaxID=708091 RepID=A0ABT0Z1H3_9FLAO|nr:uroporphyrinogen-III synthase [Gramella jeungdoensis]MCM8569573.1 uroporphyrinogen-III synthase [Gramella jeungdoensis]